MRLSAKHVADEAREERHPLRVVRVFIAIDVSQGTEQILKKVAAKNTTSSADIRMKSHSESFHIDITAICANIVDAGTIGATIWRGKFDVGSHQRVSVEIVWHCEGFKDAMAVGNQVNGTTIHLDSCSWVLLDLAMTHVHNLVIVSGVHRDIGSDHNRER